MQKKSTKKNVKKVVTTTAGTGKKHAVKKAAPEKKTSKKSAKKVSRTKTTTSEGVRTKMKVAESEKCFWMTDGRVLASLLDLDEALSAMHTDVYTYHVGSGRNDFADWVEAVLEDIACADALRKAKRATTARTVVRKHLKRYTQ